MYSSDVDTRTVVTVSGESESSVTRCDVCDVTQTRQSSTSINAQLLVVYAA